MYLLNHPADVRYVLVANHDNDTKAPVPPVESRIFEQGVLHAEICRCRACPLVHEQL